MAQLTLQPVTAHDRKWVEQFVTVHWGMPVVAGNYVVYYPHELPGFIALEDGVRIGLVTYDNVHALRFYQKRGFVLAALHRNAMAQARLLKPSIP